MYPLGFNKKSTAVAALITAIAVGINETLDFVLAAENFSSRVRSEMPGFSP